MTLLYGLSSEPIDEQRTLPVSPQRGHINAKWPFFVKSALVCNKVCLQSVYLKTVSDRVVTCKVTGLSIRAKIVAGRRPFYLKIWPKGPIPFKNVYF